MSFHSQLIHKTISKEEALKKTQELKGQGKTIVFTNGCFDIVHPGHVDYLSRARDLGDYLVLGLNTDSSVKKLNKAPNRPINNEKARALVLSGLACIDAIVLFDEATPLELIDYLIPNVLVKGDDYTVEQIVGHETVISNGGKVQTIPFLEGFSTTAIINKILQK